MRLAAASLALAIACSPTDELVVDDTDDDAVHSDLGPDDDHDGAPAGLDCDDANPLVGPSQPERCNGVDDDCDGRVDRDDEPVEGGTGPWYRDADVDGYGDDATAIWACGAPADGRVSVGGDCDDSDPNVRPGFGAGCDDTDDTDLAAPTLSRTWGQPAPLAELNTGASEIQPTMTASRLRICFASDHPDGNGGDFDIWCADREDPDEPFGAAAVQRPLNGAGTEAHPTLSPDGSEMFFTSSGTGLNTIYRATWSAQHGAYADAEVVEELTGAQNVYPTLSADGRSLLFASDRDGAWRLWRAERAGPGQPFGTPAPLTGLGPDALEPALAPDGRTVVFGVLRAWPGFSTALYYQPWAADGAGTTFADPLPLVIEGWGNQGSGGPFVTSDLHLLLHAPRVWGVDASPDNDLWIAPPKSGVVETRGVLPRTFEAEGPLLAHGTGRATATGWAADPALDGEGHLIYGPYTRELPAGNHVVTFRVRVASTGASGVAAVKVDVVKLDGTLLASVDYPWSGFADTGWRDLPHAITTAEGDVLEFRVWFTRVVGVEVDRVLVE